MIFYFDNAATTKIKPEVFDEMKPYLTEQYGNPSSIYSLGRNAKRAIELARERVANLINCEKNEIYFTSCGSESDNMAIRGVAYKYCDFTARLNLAKEDNKENKSRKIIKNHIITSKIEHNAILNTCESLKKEGFKITYLNVDSDGRIDLKQLQESITDNTILVSIMFANNEIGTVEPIEEISQIIKMANKTRKPDEPKILFHTDAVQAVGNIHIDVKELGIDILSMSGHKIHAPKGIGAIYIKKDIEINRFIYGGHQEKNMRAGTENLAEIVGFGKACEIAKNNLENHIKYLKELRDYYIKQLLKKIDKKIEPKVNGSMVYRLPGNCNISFPGIDSTELLLRLDEKGICVSNGSACNSSEPTPSHVLTSIGLDEQMSKSAIRTTFSDFNTKSQIDYLINQIILNVSKHQFYQKRLGV